MEPASEAGTPMVFSNTSSPQLPKCCHVYAGEELCRLNLRFSLGSKKHLLTRGKLRGIVVPQAMGYSKGKEGWEMCTLGSMRQTKQGK